MYIWSIIDIKKVPRKTRELFYDILNIIESQTAISWFFRQPYYQINCKFLLKDFAHSLVLH